MRQSCLVTQLMNPTPTKSLSTSLKSLVAPGSLSRDEHVHEVGLPNNFVLPAKSLATQSRGILAILLRYLETQTESRDT